MLAQRFGVTLPELVDGDNTDARRDAALRESLLKAHEVAAEYFREQLMNPGGARARQQLKDRGVSARAIEQLGLGFAPHSRDGLKDRLLSQGFAQGSARFKAVCSSSGRPARSSIGSETA